MAQITIRNKRTGETKVIDESEYGAAPTGQPTGVAKHLERLPTYGGAAGLAGGLMAGPLAPLGGFVGAGAGYALRDLLRPLYGYGGRREAGGAPSGQLAEVGRGLEAGFTGGVAGLGAQALRGGYQTLRGPKGPAGTQRTQILEQAGQTGTVIPRTEIDDDIAAIDIAGYSEDEVQGVVGEFKRKLSKGEVSLMDAQNLINEIDAIQYGKESLRGQVATKFSNILRQAIGGKVDIASLNKAMQRYYQLGIQKVPGQMVRGAAGGVGAGLAGGLLLNKILGR